MRSHLTSWKDMMPVFWREEAALWASTAGQRSKDAASNVRIDVPMSFLMTITRTIPTKIIKRLAPSPKSVFLLSFFFFGTERIGSLIKHVIVFYLSYHKTTASFYGTEKQRVSFLSTVTWRHLQQHPASQCPLYLPMDLPRCLEPWFIWIFIHRLQSLKITNTFLCHKLLLCLQPLALPPRFTYEAE